jgi:histidine ammonia-lyase
MSDILSLDGETLSIEDVVAVARQHWPVAESISESPSFSRILASANWVQQAVQDNALRAQRGEPAKAYYGINTGFGIHAAGKPLDDPEKTRQASRKLIMSHSAGVGDYLSPEIVRAAMLIRANTLAKGYSGVRPALIERLLQMLNRKIIPAIPEMGSLGASGDLAPLAHLALVLSKPPETMLDQSPAPGYADMSGEVLKIDSIGDIVGLTSGQEAMHWDGVDQRLVLEAKEGLALSNGASFSAAIAALCVHDADNLICHAELAAALALEVFFGHRDAFLPPVHQVRGHPGQIASAQNILQLVDESKLVDPGDADHDPVNQPPQDPYSLRCSPQVIGAVREAIAYIQAMLEREINAATDNPLLFVLDSDSLTRPYRAVSGGNFHGEPVALAMDHLRIAMTELGNLSERRVFWLTNPVMARGLPSMLVTGNESHIDSGWMIAQYVAAALVSDCKTLSHPDSVDNIPTSANQEDHVSMSMNAARHTHTVIDKIRSVIAIELVTLSVAIRHRLAGIQRDGKIGEPVPETDLGTGARCFLQALREIAPEILAIPLDRDVVVYPYIRHMTALIHEHRLTDALHQAGLRFTRVRSTVSLEIGE